MKRIINIELDTRREVHTQKVSFSINQYDDVELRAKIFDGLDLVELNDERIIVAVRKENGRYVSHESIMKKEDNTLIVDFLGSCTDTVGVHELELSLKDDYGISTSAITRFMVKKPLTTRIVELITSTDDIHLLFEIKEILDNYKGDLGDIKTEIDALNARINELKASLQAEYDKLKADLGAEKDKLIAEIANQKDGFIAEVGASKDQAIIDIQDRVQAEIEQAIRDIDDKVGAELIHIQQKIDEGKAILAEIQQIKDTLATKQELNEVDTRLTGEVNNIKTDLTTNYATKVELNNIDTLLKDRINQVQAMFNDYATIRQLEDTYNYLKDRVPDLESFNKLREEMEIALKSKANVDDVAREYSTHKELEDAERRLQDQINALTGGTGGGGSTGSLATKQELNAVKAELQTLIDEKADNTALNDYATKVELEDTHNQLENKKADKTDVEAINNDKLTEPQIQGILDYFTI